MSKIIKDKSDLSSAVWSDLGRSLRGESSLYIEIFGKNYIIILVRVNKGVGSTVLSGPDECVIRRCRMAIDPVCGMEVDEEKAQYVSEYQGKKYYFCSPGCKADFDNDPEAFLSAEADTGTY
jgi:YHS domain-containing protein